MPCLGDKLARGLAVVLIVGRQLPDLTEAGELRCCFVAPVSSCLSDDVPVLLLDMALVVLLVEPAERVNVKPLRWQYRSMCALMKTALLSESRARRGNGRLLRAFSMAARQNRSLRPMTAQQTVHPVRTSAMVSVLAYSPAVEAPQCAPRSLRGIRACRHPSQRRCEWGSGASGAHPVWLWRAP